MCPLPPCLVGQARPSVWKSRPLRSSGAPPRRHRSQAARGIPPAASPKSTVLRLPAAEVDRRPGLRRTVSIGRAWLRPSEFAFSRLGLRVVCELDLRADGQGSGGSSRDGRRRLPGWKPVPRRATRVDRPGHGDPPVAETLPAPRYCGPGPASGTPGLTECGEADWPAHCSSRSTRSSIAGEQYASTATPRLRPFSRRHVGRRLRPCTRARPADAGLPGLDPGGRLGRGHADRLTGAETTPTPIGSLYSSG